MSATQSLRQRIQLHVTEAATLNHYSTKHHYLHRPIHPRAVPFGWLVSYDRELFQPDGAPSGLIMFSSIHFTRLRGEFGYDGLPTKWQVLHFSRLWLHDNLPKNSETCVMGKALRLVQHRWLEVHPPKYLNQPYHVVKILSYSDERYHRGTIYRAANFRAAGSTIGKPRHTSGDRKNTRGPGTDGATLLRFVYEMAPPRWHFDPAHGLPLFQRKSFPRTRHVPVVNSEQTHAHPTS